ncbi:shootin-1-like [Erythrolamprus reginae]|uniref:shootin-1-like n=1 Tax=Erythrolamprus reginae TaxID=121349 RepID=UPI00396C7CB4
MELPETDFAPFGVIWESESGSNSEEEEDEQETDLSREMAETQEKITEIEQASQALLAELSTMEMEYEIEKSCREQAEALAIQTSRENKKLKHISLALLPRLGLRQEDFGLLRSGEQEVADSGPDPLGRCLHQVKDLQLRVSGLLEEKKELTAQVKDLQAQVEKLQHQLQEERVENQSLTALKEHNQKMMKRVKRASRLVTEEYGRMSLQLDLEEKLRQEAEIFAHQMLVKQKEANRQSLILRQNVGADGQLLWALQDVAKMTKELEDAKTEHQAKVKDLEAQLEARPLPEELTTLQTTLTTAEEGKAHLEQQLLRAEEKCATLEQKVKVLEEGAKAPDTPEEHLVAPVPPPPPPLPPPTCPAKTDPLKALRERRAAQPGKRGDPRSEDATARAVEEMMARIKSGVALRPVRRGPEPSPQPPSAAANKRRSLAKELQDLLSTPRRPHRRSSRRKGSQKKILADNQLEKLLQRRRRVVDQTPVLLEPSVPPAEEGLLPRVSVTMEEGQAASAAEVPKNPRPNQTNFSETGKDRPGEPDKPLSGAPVQPRLKIAEVAWF